jgi:hypothetical protein
VPAADRDRLGDLLPARALELMRGVPRRRDAVAIPSDADLVEFLRSSCSTEVESAGVIGDGWFTRVSGDPWQVKVEPARFTWHSHPAGHAYFSIEDFITFRAMNGAWHLLVTPTSWCVYMATGQPRIELPDRSIVTGPPTLRMRRCARWIEQALGVEPSEVEHARLCELFNVRRFDSIAAIAEAALRCDDAGGARRS